jgi:hypothetical protein
MNLRTRPVRVAAAVGAVVAAGTTVFMAVAAGTASADEPGRCTQNVNVREEADATSKIVAMCDSGTAVTIGPERDGFAYLENLHGWASKDFIKADETAAATTPPAGDATPAPSSSSSDDSSSASSDSSSDDDAVRDAATGDDHASDGDSHSGDATTHPSAPARSNSGGLGGLLH